MLDLHGTRVGDAEHLAEAVVVDAARRGRSTVRLIHGVSTTEHGAHRTIKTALHAMADDGVFSPYTTSVFRAEGSLLLGLAASPHPVAGRLSLRDLW